ncbi:stalk domain-containing protein [Bacillus sp. 31A1R]|uniref:Stalk domain-containing protein n=1 Tax=Robertmurraya mangrovi TaxID=3098077 RepID=A0ABU5IZW9_9BACI|nr:stalk domain-containing protein [Bacillus sp. 31A1R]MDZ5472686.1 stalk domain-containing protein [Bacillus sp. 31A1R]
MMKKLVSIGLTCSLLLGGIGLSIQPQQVEAKATKAYTKQQEEVRDYVNSIRKKMGLNTLELNPYLNKAAQNHSKYMLNNNHYDHKESKGRKGFTGVDASARLKAVGADRNLLKGSLSEILSSDTDKTKSIIDGFLDTSYHRESLINPDDKLIGFGIDKNYVTILITDLNESLYEPVFYPYDKQTNVGVGFYGNEIPNPLDQFKVKKSGYIISYNPGDPGVTGAKIKIRDSIGTNIPFHLEGGEDSLTWFIFPKYELAFGETYTVTVEYMAEDDDWKPIKITKTWSFTTKDKPKYSFSSGEANIKINGKYISVFSEFVNEFNTGVEYSHPVRIIKNVAHVDAKMISERLNMTTKTSGSKEITWKSKNKEVKFKVGQKTAKVNGKTVKLSQSPTTIDKKVHVPISFLKETLGAKVSYDKKGKVVNIDLKIDDPVGLKTEFKF